MSGEERDAAGDGKLFGAPIKVNPDMEPLNPGDIKFGKPMTPMAKSHSGILYLDHWESNATHLIGKKVGSAEVIADTYEQGEAYQMYGVGGYKYFTTEKDLTIAVLKIDGETWMVDDPPHAMAMEEHARRCHGHTVVVGLGLGLVARELEKNRKVKCVSIIERNPDVIELNRPTLKVGPRQPKAFRNVEWTIEMDLEELTRIPVDCIIWDLFVGEGQSHFASAIIVYKALRDQADTVCVHGYPHEQLEEVVKSMEKQFQNLRGDDGS
jgi:hypothetical protein